MELQCGLHASLSRQYGNAENDNCSSDIQADEYSWDRMIRKYQILCYLLQELLELIQ